MEPGMLFSVLVPIYNAENFLAECIESVRKQTYSNFELLLVNDGSTDNSGTICDEFAVRDSRISVFHKQNEGLLLTRRFAIRQSRGEYLLFLDSDDMLEICVLQMVYDTIHEHNADMVLYRFKKVDVNGLFLMENDELYPDHTIFTKSNNETLFAEIAGGNKLNNLCIKVVNRKIVDISADYSKHQVTMAEDLLQSLALFKNAERIVYRNKALYLYRQHDKSLTFKYNPNYFKDIDYVRHMVYDCLCELGYDTPSVLNAFFSYSLRIIIANVIRLMSTTQPYVDKKASLEWMRTNDFYQRAIAMHCHRELHLRNAVINYMFRNGYDKILFCVVPVLSYFRFKFRKLHISTLITAKRKK